MPYIKIQSDADISGPEKEKLLKEVSGQSARLLGKPETYVMTAYETVDAMTMGGDGSPCAFLAVKSIGLPQSAAAPLSQALCDLVHQSLGIPTARVYIEFSNAQGALWGWDGRTF